MNPLDLLKVPVDVLKYAVRRLLEPRRNRRRAREGTRLETAKFDSADPNAGIDDINSDMATNGTGPRTRTAGRSSGPRGWGRRVRGMLNMCINSPQGATAP